MLAVVYVPPVPNEAPPDEAEYQLTVADAVDAVAPNVTAPGPQRAAGAVAIMVGMPLIVAVTAVRVVVIHVPVVAST